MDYLKILIMLSFIDYLLGTLTVFVKGKSSKGRLSSKVMGMGVVKKICYIVLCFIAYIIDSKFNVTGMYSFVTISFIITEGISILETCHSVGVTCKPLEKYFNSELNKQESEEK